MSAITMNSYQIALVAILPKRAWGLTVDQFCAATKLPEGLVREQLQSLVASGVLVLDTATSQYSRPGDQEEAIDGRRRA